MTIAITGGTGFVGQAVLDAAERQGIALRALARTVPEGRDAVEWIQGSLSDEAALARLVEGADAVIHVAGLTNTPDPAEFEAANVTGTEALLAATRAAKIKRFVFVSSLSAREPQLSQYGASKQRAEEAVKASNINWTIIRPPGVYGPRDIDYFDMFKAAKLGIVPLPPGGASSMIHVDDLAELLLACIPASPKLRRRVFEPDDGREGGWSHKEMAREIGKAVGRKVFAPHLPKWVLSAAAGFDRVARGDKAKLTADRVGYMTHPNWVSRSSMAVPKDIWAPRIATPDGLKSTAEWYRKQGWL